MQRLIRYSAFAVLLTACGSWLCSAHAQQAVAEESVAPLPDLQGLWTYAAATPLQRPPQFGEQQAYTESQLQALENSAWQSDSAAVVGARTGFATIAPALVHGEYRTSLIIAPADGRIPYLQAPAERSAQAQATAEHSQGPESYPAHERCLAPRTQLPLLAPTPGDSLAGLSLRILQTDSYLAIHQPRHSALRIIKLAGRPLPYTAGQWMGDSLALFDAESLVINTTSFRVQQSNSLLPSSAQMQIYERFMPLDEDRLLYTYTVLDPQYYSEPFTVEMPLQRLPDNTVLESELCHENNATLPARLLSARQREAVSATAAGTK